MVEEYDKKNFGDRQKSRALMMYEEELRKQGLDPLKFMSKDELSTAYQERVKVNFKV